MAWHLVPFMENLMYSSYYSSVDQKAASNLQRVFASASSALHVLAPVNFREEVKSRPKI